MNDCKHEKIVRLVNLVDGPSWSCANCYLPFIPNPEILKLYRQPQKDIDIVKVLVEEEQPAFEEEWKRQTESNMPETFNKAMELIEERFAKLTDVLREAFKTRPQVLKSLDELEGKQETTS